LAALGWNLIFAAEAARQASPERKEFHDLASAYEFLRHVEHRLQLRQGQQTHRLPVAESGLRILQRAMEGYAPGQNTAADLISPVRAADGGGGGNLSPNHLRAAVRQLRHDAIDAPFELRGPLEPGAADQSNSRSLKGSPPIRRAARDCHAFRLEPAGPRKSFRFLWSAFSSSERYATVLRYPEAVTRALALFEASEYLTDILVRHPEEVVTLADLAETPRTTGSGYLFEGFVWTDRAARDPIFAYLSNTAAAYGDKLSMLRQQYRHRVLAAGARDILEQREVYTSLASTTVAAEDAVAAAFSIAGAPDGLVVLALGRLGSGEFDVLSDADLLFIREDEAGNDPQLLKAAAQIMQALAATPATAWSFPWTLAASARQRGGVTGDSCATGNILRA